MIERFAARLLLFISGCCLALPLYSVELPNRALVAPLDKAPVRTPDKTLVETQAAPLEANAIHLLSPEPLDGRIAFVTARLLEEGHYLHPHFDGAVSVQFFDRYLETLDPQHLHFLQSDLAEFERYRTNLDHLTLSERGVADTRPACEIFNRFLERLQQRVAYSDELLKNEKFTFETDERIVANRKDAPYPKDIAEARNLWRERLRSEYLQEKLGKIESRKQLAKESAPGSGKSGPETKPGKSDAEEIVETLSRRNHRNLHMFTEFDDGDVLEIYLTTLAHVFDPHSDYFGKAQLEQFGIMMNLSLFGIGAELRVSDEGYCTIQRLLPRGPASKSGKLKEKDRIVAVAQTNQPPVDIVNMNLNKAVQLIRGPKGTQVRLIIIPADADSSVRKEVALIRDEIPLEEQAAKSKIIDLPNANGQTNRLGLIDLPSFYANFDPANTRGAAPPKSMTADVAALIAKLKEEHVQGIILDLRFNGGGSLEEAIKLTGLFIKDGPVVQVRDRNNIQVDEDTDPSILYDGPLIVLTSRLSASASEIVAGALQDYGRALIVGDSSTHGKGTVQSVNPLKPFIHVGRNGPTNDPGALKLTIKKFYRPSGSSTQLRGVVPDIVLPSLLSESDDIGEKALKNPLEWDTIPSARFERLNLVAPYVDDLRKRADARLQSDPEYRYVREDIALFKTQHADKTISLNEAQRLKEKEEAEARQKARDKERLTRPPSNEVVYEIPLKQAALPGLPSPVARTNSLSAKLPQLRGSTGAGTNAAVASTGTGLAEPDADAEKPPAVDAPMLQAERIMVDYLSVLPKGGIAAALAH
jgi:carboxyl-terminal processing protease